MSARTWAEDSAAAEKVAEEKEAVYLGAVDWEMEERSGVLPGAGTKVECVDTAPRAMVAETLGTRVVQQLRPRQASRYSGN